MSILFFLGYTLNRQTWDFISSFLVSELLDFSIIVFPEIYLIKDICSEQEYTLMIYKKMVYKGFIKYFLSL